ncbi:hypothetical protein [Streptomyces sp. NPDC052225]|uniref:hypothetical protein n=1 Tax=Streptomyces sp. NPDC052225 TaxID=3154949 RepID=UPI00343E93CD
MFAVDTEVAHLGLAITVVVCVVIGVVGTPEAGAVVGAVFAAWFLPALGFDFLTGRGGPAAFLRAYKATFWWADRISP